MAPLPCEREMFFETHDHRVCRAQNPLRRLGVIFEYRNSLYNKVTEIKDAGIEGLTEAQVEP